jgi:hypothetical protein
VVRDLQRVKTAARDVARCNIEVDIPLREIDLHGDRQQLSGGMGRSVVRERERNLLCMAGNRSGPIHRRLTSGIQRYTRNRQTANVNRIDGNTLSLQLVVDRPPFSCISERNAGLMKDSGPTGKL